MSAQASIEDSPAGPPTGPDGGTGALRVLGLAAVCIGVAALAAATFVLSYAGIRAIALQAGIEPRYARGYPLLIDAMLVIVLAAVLGLRGAGLPSRILAWLMLLVVLAAAAGADALHATNHTLPHDAAAIIAAALPWVLVFLAFVLLLAMLRHARLRVQAGRLARPPAQTIGQYGPARPAPALPVRTPRSADAASIVPGMTSQLVSYAAAGAAAAAAGGTASDAEQGDHDGDVPGQAYEAADAGPSTAGDPFLATGDGPVEAGARGPEADPGTLAGESPAQPDDAEPALPGVSLQHGEAAPDTAEAAPDTAEAAPDTGEDDAPAGNADPHATDAYSAAAEAAPGTGDDDVLTGTAGPDTAGAEPTTAEADPDTAEADPDTAEADPDTAGADPDTAGADEQAADADPQAAEPAEDDMPVFHRMWSTPTPPGN